MGKIAEGQSGAGDAAQPWQRGATRRAILDAARLMAARSSSTDFSLNTVAKEAGYSVTTVFAYFSTKMDLFNAIVADDLATLARQMQGSYVFTPPMAEHVPLVAPQELVAEVHEAAAEPANIVTFVPPEPKAEPPGEDVGKHPARADAWLERRLRVFEKSLAEIETRLAAAQQDSSKAIAVAEENTRIFGARLDASEKRVGELSDDLTTRLTAAEKRLRDTHSDLRNSLLNASMRIDTLEEAAQRIAAGVGFIAPAVMAPVSADPELETEKPLKAAADTYLSAARRAAQTAAALADIEVQSQKKKPTRHAWFNRNAAIIAAATFVAFAIGATVSFAIGVHNGRATPVRIIAPRAAAHVKTADVTPLDKLTALANAGNAKAELLVGLRYLKGLGAPIDEPRAAKWITRASASHDPLAQYWMGQIYEHGEGVSADAAEALHWYEAAAAQGNREAMYDAGVAYAQGLGTQKDWTQSARWFAKAAALGLTNAQFNLAVLYERGEGVPQSLRDAYSWYAVAAANGDAESRSRVDAIATQLSASSLTAARHAADTFRAAPLDRTANVIPKMGVVPGA